MVDMKRNRILFMAFLLLCLIATPLLADNFKQGTELFLYNNPKDAIPLLEKALYEDPANQSIYMMLSTAYTQTNQFDKAINLLKKSIDKGVGEKAVLLYEIGRNAEYKGNPQEAIAYYTQSLAIRPNDSLAVFQRGNSYYRSGDLGNALSDYQQFLVLDPKNKQSPEVARMIAAIKDRQKALEIAKKQEEEFKAAEAAKLREAELQRQIAEEQRKKDDEARKKLMDDIYAKLNEASGEQTNLSAGSEDVKNKPADVIRED